MVSVREITVERIRETVTAVDAAHDEQNKNDVSVCHLKWLPTLSQSSTRGTSPKPKLFSLKLPITGLNGRPEAESIKSGSATACLRYDREHELLLPGK